MAVVYQEAWTEISLCPDDRQHHVEAKYLHVADADAASAFYLDFERGSVVADVDFEATFMIGDFS